MAKSSQIPMMKFLHLVDQVEYAMAVECRPSLAALCLNSTGAELIATTTDGPRAARAVTPLVDHLWCATIPRPILQLIRYSYSSYVSFSQFTRDVQPWESVMTEGMQFEWLYGGDLAWSPDYNFSTTLDKILPQSYTYSYTVTTRGIKSAIRKLRKLQTGVDKSKRKQLVCLRVGYNGELSLWSPLGDAPLDGRSADSYSSSDASDYYLNPKYLLDAISHCDGDSIQICLSGTPDQYVPIILVDSTHEIDPKNPNNDHIMAVIMPCRE